MTNEQIQKIKTRIQALLAKARSTEHEAEAELFMGKAMELLEQYQLDIGDLTDANDPIQNHMGLHAAASGHAWRWKLYRAVGALYGSKGIYVQCSLKDDKGEYVRDKHGRLIDAYEFRLIGRESAIITTNLMYPWIVSQVRDAAKAICKQHVADGYKPMSEQGQAKRVAAALIARIWSLVAQNKASTESVGTEVARRNQLMTVDAVEAAFAQHYPSTELMKGSNLSRTDAASRNAANAIGLHRQTGGAAQMRLT